MEPAQHAIRYTAVCPAVGAAPTVGGHDDDIILALCLLNDLVGHLAIEDGSFDCAVAPGKLFDQVSTCRVEIPLRIFGFAAVPVRVNHAHQSHMFQDTAGKMSDGVKRLLGNS